MSARIGIDLGGTKIEAIALDEDGTALARRRIATPQHDYDAGIRFGRTNNTYDATGETTSESPMRPTRTAVEFGLLALSGSYDQMPPAYSAKKVDGVRAYKLARQKVAFELKAVPVHIYELALLEVTGSCARVRAHFHP